MHTRFKLTIQQIATFLLLFTFVITPATNSSVLAAPFGQDAGPNSVSAPGDHLVTNISLNVDTPNILSFNQRIVVSFNYSTTNAAGVRIFARPYTNGSLTPNYSADGSNIYPASASGSGSNGFTITSGQVVIDQIQLQMWTDTQSTLLFEAYIPVYYLFASPANIVTNIALNPDTPNALSFNQNVNLTFNYSNQTSSGVQIFARPFTKGALTPNYAASGSPTYSMGTGSGSGFFTITTGQVVVDQIHIQIVDVKQTTVLFEASLPVYFRFRTIANLVTSFSYRSDTPNIFKYNQNFNLSFSYTNNQSGGVYIFARPFSSANLSPAYSAPGSPLYPAGSGIGNGSFTLTAGPMVVDKIRIQMWDSTQTVLLYEEFLPVNLRWAGPGPAPGPDMHVDALEVTQAIQDLNNSVDLVAGKRTYVRMHVSSPSNLSGVYATLSGQKGFTSLTPILNPGNPGSAITVKTSPDRGQINDSFWFELPLNWTNSGSLTLTARLDPNNAKNDLNQANNSHSVTVTFNNTPPLRLKILDVQYTSGGTTYLAANSHLDGLESWLRRAYPISSLQVTRQTYIYPSSGLPNVDTLHGWLAFSKLLNTLFSGEDSRMVYYGMVDDGGGFMRGKAVSIPGTIAAGPTGTGNWGWDYDGSYGDWYGGHEIGHTRGRSHAEFCGAGGGAPYPYTGGRISPDLTGNGAIYGFDITTHAIYPPSWTDVMTYCSSEWMSDFTYEAIRNYLVGTGFNAAEPNMVTASAYLAVQGMAELNTGNANLENVYLLQQDKTLPLPVPGDWTIALVNGSNTDLATYPFTPQELTDAEGSSGKPAVIAEVVPWVVGTTQVQIRHAGQVLDSQSASAHAPTVTLTSPTNGANLPDGPFQAAWTGSDADGNALTYSILYSNDGINWQTLATDLTGNTLSLNTQQLAGGTGHLRVIASDGFLTGQDTKGPFTVPQHAPTVQILQPTPNQVFYPGQQVVFQGSAYDLEDGTLGDAAFQWSSSIDGVLGTGATLDTSELTQGTHTITLTVTDSSARTTQVQTTIVVGNEDTSIPVNLQSAPAPLSLVVMTGSAPFQTTITLRSSGTTELSWSASESIPWLTLDKASGTTPDQVVATVDPKNLRIGLHSGQITFTASGAGNSPDQVTITLSITGNSIFLPLTMNK